MAVVPSDGTTNNEQVLVVAELTQPPLTKKYPFKHYVATTLLFVKLHLKKPVVFEHGTQPPVEFK